jgi:hypothetical protein
MEINDLCRFTPFCDFSSGKWDYAVEGSLWQGQRAVVE